VRLLARVLVPAHLHRSRGALVVPRPLLRPAPQVRAARVETGAGRA